MTQPKPAPVKPQPIRNDPKVGQWQVVATWRVLPTDRVTMEEYRWAIEHFLERQLGLVQGRRPAALSVGVCVIGAGGETSEHEGTVGL